ncbi:hypothetical protein SAMN03159343_3527 [Klenkia marina]|uniref:Uncharacterized protein n=1 Tax=Klenkia marina TaxID=1960309 RepID=A0A1G4YTV5_9ACTN|nr:hypothetical protein [Klenkia marina]SCX56887.1 hypothetical protein SAMN03159343_3527 [Klenkia marina]
MTFAGFLDDAAVFPPGDAPMAVAVPAHARLVAELGDLVGPFVVPTARLDELAHVLQDDGLGDDGLGDGGLGGGRLGGGRLAVSVIAAQPDVPAAVSRVAAVAGLRLAAVEVPGVTEAAQWGRTARGARHPDPERALDGVPADVPVFVELPRTAARDDLLDALAATGTRAKLRTGGLRADLFPSAAELAGTITACAQRGVPFKCTAGLHAALPHTDPATGFAHHGFLTVLLAAHAAATGGDPEAWLREHDAERVVAGLRAADLPRARAAFTSFGTCSVTEPAGDLRALGLLPAPDRIPA